MKTSKWFKMSPKLMLGLALLFMTTISLQAQNYAFMYIADGSSASTSLNDWHVVGSSTDADFVEGKVSPDWGCTSNSLVADPGSGGGNYLVSYSLSFSGALTTWDVGISVNGGTPSELLGKRTISSVNKDAGNISGSGHMVLLDAAVITLCVKPTVAGTFTPIQAQVVLVELTENTTNYYGGMQIRNFIGTVEDPIDVQSLSSAYTTVTGFITSGELNEWNYASNQLTAGSNSAGTYLVSFSASINGEGNVNSPRNYTVGIVKNGSSAVPTQIVANRITDEFDNGNIKACGIISIIPDDIISLEAKAGSNNELTFVYASVSLQRISGTTASPYKSMEITANQIVSIGTASTWTEVGTFAEGSPLSSPYWNFSSNVLNPISGTASAGMYRLDYSLSVNSASAGTGKEYFLVGIFVGSNEHPELTNKRQLSGSGDIGAVGGNGIVNIASVDSTIVMKIQNLSNTNNLTVKTANVSLHRIVIGPHDTSLPVELSKWSASSGRGDVKLEWTTESEVENQGFIIERKLSDASEFRQIASYTTDETLNGQGSTSQRSQYEFIDADVQVGQRYDYRLSDVDYKGKIALHDIISVVVSQEEHTQQPVSLSLMHAYPNPFNPATTIEYGLSQASFVNLTIYDVGGNEIARLFQGSQEAGWHTAVWNGLNNQGQPIPTGVYLAHLEDQSNSKVIKISYLK